MDGDIMDELKITKRTEPVMFTIRVDKSIVDFYDELSRKTNRSRNELIGMALEFAKDKIKVENLKERVFDLGYSDFFKIKEDGQFEW